MGDSGHQRVRVQSGGGLRQDDGDGEGAPVLQGRPADVDHGPGPRDQTADQGPRTSAQGPGTTDAYLGVGPQQAASFNTVFQLRAVPRAPSFRSITPPPFQFPTPSGNPI